MLAYASPATIAELFAWSSHITTAIKTHFLVCPIKCMEDHGVLTLVLEYVTMVNNSLYLQYLLSFVPTN